MRLPLLGGRVVWMGSKSEIPTCRGEGTEGVSCGKRSLNLSTYVPWGAQSVVLRCARQSLGFPYRLKGVYHVHCLFTMESRERSQG